MTPRDEHTPYWRVLGWLGGQEPTSVERLAGDASDRVYWRLTNSQGEHRVAMVYGPGHAEAIAEFLAMQRWLAACGLPVPALEESHPEPGIVLLDDLGQILLSDLVAERGVDEAYPQAVDLLADMQLRARYDPDCPAFHRSFDTVKLKWELDFFITHTIENYHGIKLPFSRKRALDDELTRLVRLLDVPRKIVAHRDFHSRNIMVSGGRLVLIDFQDARLGSPLYDVVSLLRDSYVELSADQRAALFSRYLDAVGDTHFRGWNRGALDEAFELHALQRNLKAAGSFGYLTTVKRKSGYAEVLPYTYHMVQPYLDAQQERWPMLRELVDDAISAFSEGNSLGK